MQGKNFLDVQTRTTAPVRVGETAQNAGFSGGAVSRPVAAIIIGPNGVHVEPIVDATKVVLAFFSAIGAFLLMLAKMCRFSRTGKLN